MIKVIDKHLHAGESDEDMEDEAKPCNDSLADDVQHLVKAIKGPNNPKSNNGQSPGDGGATGSKPKKKMKAKAKSKQTDKVK